MKKLLLLLGLLANLALAAPIPEEMVRNTSKDVVDILKKPLAPAALGFAIRKSLNI